MQVARFIRGKRIPVFMNLLSRLDKVYTRGQCERRYCRAEKSLEKAALSLHYTPLKGFTDILSNQIDEIGEARLKLLKPQGILEYICFSLGYLSS